MSSDDNKTGDDGGDDSLQMTSSQPYLIRAIYEWIVDNNLTPYLMVDATKDGAIVPEDYLDEQGRIILNISPSATSELLMTNEEVTFNARFSGQAIGIVVPTYCVKAIYARENGQGMMFNDEGKQTAPSQSNANQSGQGNSNSKGKGGAKKKRAALESVSGAESNPTDPTDDPKGSPLKKPPTGGKGRKGPNLKVVK